MKSHCFKIAVLILVSSQAFAKDDSQKSTDPELTVTSVTLDRNTALALSSTLQKTAAANVATEACSEIVERLLVEKRLLQQKLDRRAGRDELATGLATIRLTPCGPNDPRTDASLRIHPDDRFEVGSVRLLSVDAKRIHWFPLNQVAGTALKGGDAPVGDAPVGDAPVGDAPVGDAPVVNPPKRPGNQPQAALSPQSGVISSDQTRSSDREARTIFMAAAELLSQGESKRDDAKIDVELSDVSNLTYQQPAPPWKVYYVLHGKSLSQWASVGNFSRYVWGKDVPIQLTDLGLTNKSISFCLNEPIGPGKQSFERIQDLRTTSVEWSFRLGKDGHPTRFFPSKAKGYFPDGELRATGLKGGAGFQVAKYTELRKGVKGFSIGEDPQITIKGKWDAPLKSGEILSVNNNVYSVRRQRQTTLEVSYPDDRIISPPNMITLRKTKELNAAKAPIWKLFAEGWTEGSKTDTYSYAIDSDREKLEILEFSVASASNQLNLMSEEDRVSLLELAAANSALLKVATKLETEPADRIANLRRLILVPDEQLYSLILEDSNFVRSFSETGISPEQFIDVFNTYRRSFLSETERKLFEQIRKLVLLKMSLSNWKANHA